MSYTQDLPAIEGEMTEIEEERRKLKAIQNELGFGKYMKSRTRVTPELQTPEEKEAADGKSVYVGNVDYSATEKDLEEHFHGCGSVARVTILRDKYSGHPKGFAYVEFTEREGMQKALAMTDSLLRGRQIKVNQKRTNKPGVSSTNRPPFRGPSQQRGSVVVIKYVYTGGFRGRGNATRRRPGFAPY